MRGGAFSYQISHVDPALFGFKRDILSTFKIRVVVRVGSWINPLIMLLQAQAAREFLRCAEHFNLFFIVWLYSLIACHYLAYLLLYFVFSPV